MAEETEDARVEGGGAPDTSGLAIDLAMEEARGDPALRGHVAAFLEDQRALIADQRHHMRIQLRQLRLGIAEKWLGVLLRVATAFTGLAVAAGLAYLIWNAASSNNLVMDSFQVPPVLADKGLSGPVVAAKLSDKVAAMQNQITSQRAPKSYANGVADGLKLDIPETGVSLAELDRFLRAKLGHDLHIGGEMVQDEKGIALTVRVGTGGSATVTGTEAEMDMLLQKLAEQVYRITQPYRYGVFLQAQGRVDEGIAVLRELSGGGPATERAWAFNGWGVAVSQWQGGAAGAVLLQRGLALDPENYLLTANVAAHELNRGHVEDAVQGYRKALALLLEHGRDYTLPDRIDVTARGYRSVILLQQGAVLEAAEQRRLSQLAGGGSFNNGSGGRSEALALLHEPAAARAVQAQTPPPVNIGNAGTALALAQRANTLIELESQDWPAALAAARDFTPLAMRFPGLAEDRLTMIDPQAALALAHLGRFAEAQARLKPMPGDCYACLRARAQVAALQGQPERADWWFARAAAIGPSLPYAQAEWGRALLARGKPDDAIAHFTAANRIGPKFADPLEGWGEALMANNQSHLALAKFAAAEKLAPNWGRLQMKWGEALVYAGKKEDAAGHFARAATLDLTPSEKSELAKVRHG